MSRAESGIDKMLTVVDSLIIIPNENLYDMVDMDNYSYEQALSVVDDILRQGVQGISDIITQTGFINVDFADVKTMISLSNGRAHLGIGVGKGDERLQKAITNAFENPLLDVSSIKNARGILANIVCPKDFAMREYREASKIINNYANENANIKIGVCPKEDIKDEIIVTIVATGFDANAKNDSDNKDVDENANDRFNINRSLNSSSNTASKINNSSTSNETTNKSENIVVDMVETKKVEEVQKVETPKAALNPFNDKKVTETVVSSNNKAENISEIDDINTIVKEPEEEKEVELGAASVKTEEVKAIEKVQVAEEPKAAAEVHKTEEIKEIREEKAEVKPAVSEVKTAEIKTENRVVENRPIDNKTIETRTVVEEKIIEEERAEEEDYSFENKIKNLRKPLITKSTRFNNNEHYASEELSANDNSNMHNSNVHTNEVERFKKETIRLKENREKLEKYNISLDRGISCYEFLKRPETNIDMLYDMGLTTLTDRAAKQVETIIKYSGYISLQEEDIKKYKSLEDKKIPDDFDYSNIAGLRREYREKLSRIRPKTLGQALRIPGMSMSAVSILEIAINKEKRNNG